MSAEDNAAKLERLAELLVMADSTDMPALAEVHGGFEDVVRWATEEGHAEVAEAIGESHAAVRKRYSRALFRLHDELKDLLV